MLKIKRAYELPTPDDGTRILVDRLWPRGLSKENACIDEWRRDLAPSDELRKWYAHDPEKWEDFRKRYLAELESAGKMQDLRRLAERAETEDITLVFGAKDTEHSNAKAIQEFLKHEE